MYLQDIVAVTSDDPAKLALELRCVRCDEHLCDVEGGDQLGVLVSVAEGHECQSHTISKRALATILMALRYWQQDLVEDKIGGFIADAEHCDGIEPLTVDEIDVLCDRLNGGF